MNDVWRVDPSRSSVGFAIRKLGAGTVHGRLTDFGSALDHGGSVRVASIATGDAARDAHLGTQVALELELQLSR